jgi:hypothetical protein
MSVINTEHDYNCCSSNPGVCILCRTSLGYPFLHWDSIKICGSCCKHIKNGFIADLIQVVATMEIISLGGRDHSGYYGNVRLVRKTVSQIEAEEDQF